MSADGNKKIIAAAFLANLAIMVAKSIAAAYSGSTAMLAESLHSLADTGNQALLLVGIWLSHKPADHLHPFGYGKENYFWAFVVAITMFVVGAVVSVWQGVDKLFHPHHIESIRLAVIVLVFGMVFEALALSYAVFSLRDQIRGHTLWQFIRNSKEPAAITVLMEDSAALIGLSIAMAGLLLGHYTGIAAFDGIASIVIGLLLAAVAVVLSVETKSLLVGESVDPRSRSLLIDTLVGRPEIKAVNDLKTMHLGPNRVLVVARVQLIDGLDLDGVEDALDQAETAAREALSIIEHIYLEVDGAME